MRYIFVERHRGVWPIVVQSENQKKSDIAKLRMSPAMAAGVTDRLWEIGDIVKLIEVMEAEAAPKVRGPYRKREISN